MFRRAGGKLEVLLARPGGPWWRGKDAGAWTLPKGEYEAPEEPLAAALREWQEETGFPANPPFIPLGEVVQKAGKRVTAWAFEGDCDPAALCSNTFSMEWPPKSGRQAEFPEVDRAEWFTIEEARVKILESQVPLLEELRSVVLS